MPEAIKNEPTDAWKETIERRNELWYTSDTHKIAFAEGRTRK